MEQRSTSLDNLPTNNSSNTLVNDILREMNDTPSQGQQNNENFVGQGQNEQAFARQIDAQAQNVDQQVQPTPEQMQELHNQEVELQKDMSETQQVLEQEQVQEQEQGQEQGQGQEQQNAYAPSIPSGLMPGLSAQKGSGFDIIQFVKTILLFMILYILFSLPDIHKILCKLPFLCKNALDGSTSLNFIGIVLCALVGGVIFSTVQTFV